jgi:hypothetical protein
MILVNSCWVYTQLKFVAVMTLFIQRLANWYDASDDKLTYLEFQLWQIFEGNKSFDVSCMIDNRILSFVYFTYCKHGNTPFC